MYLYDTNILSELRKPLRNDNFTRFIKNIKRAKQQVYISSVTIGELIKGIERLKHKNDFEQAQILQNWFANDLSPFVTNAIPFDNDCAEVWGKLIAKNPHNEVDKQLVATALVHDLILVTRNVKDIEETGVRFINPFE